MRDHHEISEASLENDWGAKKEIWWRRWKREKKSSMG